MKTFISTLLTIFIVAFTSVSAEPAINSDTAKVVNKNTGSFSFFIKIDNFLTEDSINLVGASFVDNVSVVGDIHFIYEGRYTSWTNGPHGGEIQDIVSGSGFNLLNIKSDKIKSGSVTMYLVYECTLMKNYDSFYTSFHKTININENENTSLGVLYLKPILKDGNLNGITIEEEK